MSVNVYYWKKKFDDIPFSKVSIKMIHGFPFIVYNFGKYGELKLKADKDCILEKLYKCISNSYKCSHNLKLSCKCWFDQIDLLYETANKLYENYLKDQNIQPFVKFISEYNPEYRDTGLPRYSYVILGLHDRCYLHETPHYTNFISELLKNVNSESAMSLCSRSSARIGKWFFIEGSTDCSNNVRIIGDLGINRDDPIQARICNTYDEWARQNEYQLDELFNPDKDIKSIKDSKIISIISNFSYDDMISALKRKHTDLQSVQVQCGGAPMYDDTDYEFAEKFDKES